MTAKASGKRVEKKLSSYVDSTKAKKYYIGSLQSHQTQTKIWPLLSVSKNGAKDSIITIIENCVKISKFSDIVVVSLLAIRKILHLHFHSK